MLEYVTVRDMDTVHLISNLGITGDLERRRDVGDILSELSDTPFFCCTSIYHPSPTLQKIKYPYKYRRGGGGRLSYGLLLLLTPHVVDRNAV